MKIFVVARYNSGMMDWELQAINGYEHGPKHESEPCPLTPEIAEEVMKEFETLYPDNSYWNITIEKES